MDNLFGFVCMLLFEFKFTVAALTTRARRVLVPEAWPFGGDRIQVFNASTGIATLIGTSYWLDRQWMMPADT